MKTKDFEPDDFEPGEEVTHLFVKSPNPGVTLSIRLSAQEAFRVFDEANRCGVTSFELVRLALFDYLDRAAQSTGNESRPKA